MWNPVEGAAKLARHQNVACTITTARKGEQASENRSPVTAALCGGGSSFIRFNGSSCSCKSLNRHTHFMRGVTAVTAYACYAVLSSHRHGVTALSTW